MMVDLDLSEWEHAVVKGKTDTAAALVFADWLEEHGELGIANGWRKIVKEKPNLKPYKSSDYPGNCFLAAGWKSVMADHQVPLTVYKELVPTVHPERKLPNGYGLSYYPTAFAAIHDVATAISKLE